ncbi:MAG TPA: DUF3500 domain-containing protein [Flavisolibacter sp.]|nr:DUF3500 domain-containing protein [Flavisolibacter sp.]
MKKHYLLLIILYVTAGMNSNAQNIIKTAADFISTLDSNQKLIAVYPFDTDERFNFHFFPKNDRKGISLNDLNNQQKQAAFNLLKSGLSENAFKKAKEIRELETILKDIEHRKADDHFRDPGKYYMIIFGIPGENNIWGWRFEGHHVSFSFFADKNKLVSGTPGFLGANPAIVQAGPQKGMQVLKEEEEMGFDLLHSLSKAQLKITVIDTLAPNEIITFVSRNAMIEHPAGIGYNELDAHQQEKLLQLLKLYINRYTKLFADEMLKEIQQAGLNNIKFSWAGHTVPGIGNPNYYRIQGPTIIVEYDNSQNNANHVHTVIRDLKNDFGGDMLLQHYRASH